MISIQNRRGREPISHVGTWVGKQRRGNKKNYTLGRIIFLLSVFLVHLVSATNRPYMWIFKRDFVRRVGGLILVRNVLNFFIIYSIEKGVGGGCLPTY